MTCDSGQVKAGGLQPMPKAEVRWLSTHSFFRMGINIEYISALAGLFLLSFFYSRQVYTAIERCCVGSPPIDFTKSI